jgi:dihydropteroate synthase
MGVLNVTPDSFSDGGRYLDRDAAVARGREMIAEGADVIDVGGESTRPGADQVPEEEEVARVVPVIEVLCREARVSVDTCKPGVAAAAVEAGASLVNDVTASLHAVAADAGVGWVAMHMQGTPRTMQHDPRYDDVVQEVRDHLVARADAAVEAGVREVWIDPGIGFGKTVDHNFDLLASLDRLVDTGYPVVVGTSRKSSLGDLTGRSDAQGRHPSLVPPAEEWDTTPPDDRLEASLATATWAMAQGVRMVRVHDVRASVQAAKVVAG